MVVVPNLAKALFFGVGTRGFVRRQLWGTLLFVPNFRVRRSEVCGEREVQQFSGVGINPGALINSIGDDPDRALLVAQDGCGIALPGGDLQFGKKVAHFLRPRASQWMNSIT